MGRSSVRFVLAVMLTVTVLTGGVPARVALAVADQASLDSQSGYPTINPGESAHIYVVVRNTGTNTWRANGASGYGYRGTDGWASYGNGNLWRDVAPNTTISFEETVRPPSTPGLYRYGFEITRNGISIGPWFYIDVYVRAPSNCDNQSGVQLYEHTFYGGRCWKTTGDSVDPFGWAIGNDAASSIRVIGNWTATLYEHGNYGGVSSTFIADDPDLRNHTIGNDRASSIRVSPRVAPPPPAPWSVSLSAGQASVPAQTSVRLTARANQDVAPTPHFVVILTGSTVVKSCGIGSECTVDVTNGPSTINFTAVVGGRDGTSTVLARSNGVQVQWVAPPSASWSVTLQASKTNPRPGEAVMLTARASQDVRPTPFYIVIRRDGLPLTSCGGGSTCSISTTQANTVSHTYEAVVADRMDGGGGQVASAPAIQVSWGTPTSGAFQFQDLPVPASSLNRLQWYGNTDWAYQQRFDPDGNMYCQTRGLHSGVDFIVPMRTEIRSVVNRTGRVIAVKGAPYNWKAEVNLAIDYGDYIVLYGHVSESHPDVPNYRLPTVDTQINPNDFIAYSGTDGYLAHLHLEVIKKDPSWPNLSEERRRTTKPGNDRTNPVPMFTSAARIVMAEAAGRNGTGGTFHSPTANNQWQTPESQPDIKPTSDCQLLVP